jgi:hypothetical protein
VEIEDEEERQGYFLLKMRVYQSVDTSKWPRLPVLKDRQRENVQKSPQSPDILDKKEMESRQG